jgi:hypothetical protein
VTLHETTQLSLLQLYYAEVENRGLKPGKPEAGKNQRKLKCTPKNLKKDHQKNGKTRIL